jgi:competence protein ComEC
MNSIGFIVAWLAGCVLGLLLMEGYPRGLNSSYGLALIVCGILILVPLRVGWEDKRVRWACLFLLAGLWGCGRALLVHPPVTQSYLAYYNSTAKTAQVRLIGTISDEPLLLDRWQRVRVSAEQIFLPGNLEPKPVSGDMLTLLPRYPAYNISERLVLTGTIGPPPQISGFDYEAYLARKGVYSYMPFPKAKSLGPGKSDWLSQAVAAARKNVTQALEKSIPEPEAALAVGVVVGDRTSIPQDLQSAFQVSGTTHVLAISGQNIALIVGFVWLIYARSARSRRMPAWLTLLVILCLAIYTLFTGATPSVVRAAIMGAVLLPGPLFGRRYDPIAAVAISSLLMSLLDPNVLMDAGFQLSFGAMLGIVLVSPHLNSALERLRVPALLRLPVSASLGAQAVTLPLTLLLTGRVSLVSSLATLCIDFALLPLMITGIITGIIGTVLPAIASIIGLSAWIFAGWMIVCVKFWASFPLASISLSGVGVESAIIYYVTLGSALWLVRARVRGDLTWFAALDRRAVALAFVGLAAWATLIQLVFVR